MTKPPEITFKDIDEEEEKGIEIQETQKSVLYYMQQ